MRKEKTDSPKVVLDTNVLISAFLSPEGVPAQILFQAARGFLRICYNQMILDEYEEVLSRSKFNFEVTPEERRFVLDTLKENGLPYNASAISVFSMKDESDRAFYDVAQSAGAFLITGNIKHYPSEPFIVTPRNFMDTVLDQSPYREN